MNNNTNGVVPLPRTGKEYGKYQKLNKHTYQKSVAEPLDKQKIKEKELMEEKRKKEEEMLFVHGNYTSLQ